MSFYFYVYMRYPERFSREGFQEYCRGFGLLVTIPEQFTLSKEDTLFSMTIRKQDGSERELNIVLDPGATVRRPRSKKVTFWDKLLKRYPFLFQEAVRGRDAIWRLCGSTYGEMDDLVIFLLGGYLVEACDGVLEAPDVDKFFATPAQIAPEIREILDRHGSSVI